MEKEKRKQQPRKNPLLYIALTFLGCAICFGCYVFLIIPSDCTWNKLDTPDVSVPQSSTLVSENINRIKGRPWAETTLQYVDNVLNDEALLAYFDSTGICEVVTGPDNYARCSGSGSFWGTSVEYRIFIDPTNNEQQTTEYTTLASWHDCRSPRWEWGD